MKKIVILTDRMRIADKIGNDLRYVFQDKVIIEKLTFEDTDNMSYIDGDVLLFTLGNRIERVKKKILHPENILIVSRTIKEKNFVKIFEIPKNTDVLVVNDNYENTLQTVSLLYDLNVDNIKLKPYKEDDYDKSITVAITPGEPDKVPPTIKKIINIGDRCLDLSTFMNIIYHLRINDDNISRRLLRYANENVNCNEGISRYYKDAVVKNIQMERVLEMSDTGIVMTLPDGEIILCNKQFEQIVGIKITEGKSRLEDVFNYETLELFKQDKIENAIIKFQNMDIVIKKNKVVYEKDIYQNVYFFENVTYLKSLEQTISEKIKLSGFVAKYNLDDIVHVSKAMNKCIEKARIFAETEKTILILGESGTGKELLAQSIHNLSKRSLQPFVPVNCAAVPANLLESELFGYVKGAFTGASKEGKQGMFECANNGTIFLDEIGDMPYELQSRLLRVIQEKQIMRIGSDKVVDINVRIIAATNKNLLNEVENGKFRKDLYYRISVLPIKVPSVRERRDDIMCIFKSFLKPDTKVPVEIEEILMNYDWPGNVREMRNVAEYFELMKGYDKSLPDYLEGKKISGENNDISLEACIMKILHEKYGDSSGIGREGLKKELKHRFGREISEYSVRLSIKKLESNGYITKTKGRKGTVLTEKGEKALSNNEI